MELMMSNVEDKRMTQEQHHNAEHLRQGQNDGTDDVKCQVLKTKGRHRNNTITLNIWDKDRTTELIMSSVEDKKNDTGTTP